MTDGEFEQGTAGGADYVSVKVLDFIASGDLNGDGLDEVVALVSENHGGTGVFVFVAVYSDANGRLTFLTSIIVDDRPQVNSLSIANNEIFLDAVTVDPVTGFALFENTNYHRTRRKGVELGFNAPVKEWLTVFGTYTYVNAELRSGAFESGNKIPGVAPHMASGGVNLRLLENWRLDVRGRWMGEYYAISDWNNVGDKVDSWTTVDCKITFQWKEFEAFAGVNNIFDKKYAEYVVYTNSLNELALYPSPERNFLVGLRYAY